MVIKENNINIIKPIKRLKIAIYLGKYGSIFCVL